MTFVRSIRGFLVAGVALLALPVVAHAEGGAQTFRDFEHHHSGAARVQVARDSLARMIPAGTSLAAARATLRTAGAFCGSADRCSFSAFEANHDTLHSIAWTVDLHHRDGRVSNLSVERETYGS